MAGRKKSGPEKGSVVESKDFTYLPAGVGVSPERGEPSLDPELAKIRDEEIKRNEQVPSRAPLGEPTIDPEVVEARKADLERDAKRAKDAGVETRAKSSGNDNVSEEPSGDSEAESVKKSDN
jgi:hypothetical protein